MIRDYKRNAIYSANKRRRIRPLFLLAIPLALTATAVYATLQILETPNTPVRAASKPPAVDTIRLALPIPAKDTPADAATPTIVAPQAKHSLAQLTTPTVPPETTKESVDPPPRLFVKKHQIHSGENLAIIFSKLGLSANLLHRIVSSNEATAELAHIKPGETLYATLDADGNLQELILEHSAIRSLKIIPDGNSFRATEVERQLEPRTAHATGTVTNSLFISAQQAGLSDKLIMELANMFGWDIDFALEIRAGDSFSVVYQEDFLDGDKHRDGPILAAEFINRGRIFRAIRYVDATGRADYFSPSGKSVRKAFLRSPVDFHRISSRFQKSRWHPVLGKKRPHRGVDYAASTGTPIKASGDGKIIHRARKGGYGRTVIIEHGGGITTLYGHMSRYASKQRRGNRIRQGQTIGYVGKSGLATGPHLHYEFRINGTHRNPLTVKLPAASPIAKKYLVDFKQQAAPLIARLDVLSETLVAEAKP